MNQTTASSLPPRSALVPGIAAGLVLLHLCTAARYGIFRDELYYIACARHLASGYVDHPPAIARITWLVLHTLGSSLFALRLLPALASGALVWMTAEIAREWGGSRSAQALAALAIVPVPVYLILQHWLTMNAFEPLLWTGALWAGSRVVLRGEPRYWLATGLLTGLGVENKYSMLLPVAGLLLGLLLTPDRRWLRNRWFAAGTMLAALAILPNLLWLIHHGFPFLEFERHSRESDSRILRGPVAFLLDQACIMNPVLAPLWIGGLAWLFRQRRLRFLGIAAGFVILTLLLLQAKNYYVAPIYPVLLAAGAVAIDAYLTRSRALRALYPGITVISGCMLAPLVMPLLSIPGYLTYHRLWHNYTPVVFENEPGALLPQYFSDEFGWQQMAEATARVYHQLPPAQQAATAIFANDYGQAAAIDYFGPRYGLPRSISKAETFWLWGPRRYDGSSVIVLGSDGQGDREHFASVVPAGRVDSPLARSDEHFDIFYCQHLNQSLQQLWPQMKAW